MKTVNIHTDGACAGNQSRKNVGGWGAVLEYGPHVKEIHGGERDTTNNRMEMTALIAALGALTREGLKVRVFSDSAYLTECFRYKWHVNWAKNGWMRGKALKAPVENRDLWESLLALTGRHDCSFYRVKGHVSLAKSPESLEPIYRKFLEWNGPEFGYEDFLHATKMNNRADELANMGAAEAREGGGGSGAD
ncbi:MAG: ribonuclease HI [Clostridiales Family XIII bacterium]|jgi:ribonuclease HI|nr:ribonuclease HI [Clostridiales Family XIII bacterium]